MPVVPSKHPQKKSKVRIPIKKNKSPYEYHIKDNLKKRRSMLDKIIKWHSAERNISERSAAISKKRHLNTLRIYRKNKHDKKSIKNKRILTSDMKYLDKKYELGKTNEIR